jgi:hypothetical protein
MQLIFALLLAASAAARADEGAPVHPEAGMTQRHHGELVDVDHSQRAFTVETPKGPERFTLIEGGTVLVGGREAAFDELQVGQQVAVEGMQDDADRQRARSVQVVDPNELEGQLEDEPAFDVADTATVTSVDPEADLFEVKTQQGLPRVYRITDETRIQRGRDRIVLRELASGDRVAVTADETSPGRWTARSVIVVSTEAAPADAR